MIHSLLNIATSCVTGLVGSVKLQFCSTLCRNIKKTDKDNLEKSLFFFCFADAYELKL